MRHVEHGVHHRDDIERRSPLYWPTRGMRGLAVDAELAGHIRKRRCLRRRVRVAGMAVQHGIDVVEPAADAPPTQLWTFAGLFAFPSFADRFELSGNSSNAFELSHQQRWPIKSGAKYAECGVKIRTPDIAFAELRNKPSHWSQTHRPILTRRPTTMAFLSFASPPGLMTYCRSGWTLSHSVSTAL